MAYKNHHFCWHGIVSTDVDKTKAFYTAAVGWTATSVPMGVAESTMFSAADGVPRAHLSPPHVAGMPSFWENYLRVESVDDTHAKALANGGTELAPPTDIPVGRFSVVASPSGAALHLFREADPDQSENAGGGLGSIVWTELFSQDVAADLAWLTATFGFTIQDMPIPEGTYNILQFEGEGIGGCMQAPGPDIPSHWMSWVDVDDADAAAARVTANGGAVHGEIMDMPGVGRMVVCNDSTGAVFGIMKPADQG